MNVIDPTPEILKADESRYQALYAQNIATLSQMLDEDYLHTHANGRTEGKDAFLASITAAKYRFVTAHRQDQRVRLFGEIAFLSGQVRTSIEANGEIKTLHNAFFTAWRQEGLRWMLLHWQATKIIES